MNNKTCVRCLKEKPIDEFYKRSTHKDGHMSWCKLCVSEHGKIYFQEHKEEARQRQKLYHAKNHDKLLKYSQEYRSTHKKEMASHSKKYKKNNPEYVKEYQLNALLNRYKITQEKYDSMYEEQNYCCAICGVNEKTLNKKLCVDHDHKSGKVRGLLCNNCNFAIGAMKDDPTILENAIAYLRIFVA